MSDAPPAARRLYWLIVIAAAASAANVIGLAGRVADLPRDSALALSLSPWIGVAQSALWAVVFAGLAVALWRRRTARAAVRWAAPLFTLYALIGLLLLAGFARADYDRGRIGAEVVLSSLVLAPMWWTARRRNRSAARPGEGAA